MRTENVPDYSIVRVGKYSEALGGPKTQSLRNQNGAHFRELIDAFAATAGKSVKKAPARPLTNVERAIDEIADMGSRTALRMMLEERRRLEAENDQLRSSFKHLSVSTKAAAPIQAQAQAESIGSNSNLLMISENRLDESMISALAKFLEDRWLEERLWTAEPDGSITDQFTNGDMIAPPGFVDALREVLRMHGSETKGSV
jgi:regulator of replication initiation timing